MNKLDRNSTGTQHSLLNERLSEKPVLRIYRSAEKASSSFLLRKPFMSVRLTSSDFGVLHSGCKCWKLTDFKFKKMFPMYLFLK